MNANELAAERTERLKELRKEEERQRAANREQFGRRRDLRDASALVGTCRAMCPEKQRFEREQFKDLHVFERVDPRNASVVDHALAVKKYVRSAACQEDPLPNEIRAPDVLEATLDYLLDDVLPRSEAPENWPFADMHAFVRDRGRSIRQDLTYQNIKSPVAVALVEKITRFHVHSQHSLCEEPSEAFDSFQNMEQLNKSLVSLGQLYDDLAAKGLSCPNEGEFRAYYILSHLREAETSRYPSKLRRDVYESAPVRRAVRAYQALLGNNYVGFFNIVRESTYLEACLLHRHFPGVRCSALRTMQRVYREENVPMVDVCRILGLDGPEECTDIAAHHGISVEMSAVMEPGVFFGRRNQFVVPKKALPVRRSRDLVEVKIRGRTVTEIVRSDDPRPDASRRASALGAETAQHHALIVSRRFAAARGLDPRDIAAPAIPDAAELERQRREDAQRRERAEAERREREAERERERQARAEAEAAARAERERREKLEKEAREREERERKDREERERKEREERERKERAERERREREEREKERREGIEREERERKERREREEREKREREEREARERAQREKEERERLERRIAALDAALARHLVKRGSDALREVWFPRWVEAWREHRRVRKEEQRARNTARAVLALYLSRWRRAHATATERRARVERFLRVFEEAAPVVAGYARIDARADGGGGVGRASYASAANARVAALPDGLCDDQLEAFELRRAAMEREKIDVAGIVTAAHRGAAGNTACRIALCVDAEPGALQLWVAGMFRARGAVDNGATEVLADYSIDRADCAESDSEDDDGDESMDQEDHESGIRGAGGDARDAAAGVMEIDPASGRAMPARPRARASGSFAPGSGAQEAAPRGADRPPSSWRYGESVVSVRVTLVRGSAPDDASRAPVSPGALFFVVEAPPPELSSSRTDTSAEEFWSAQRARLSGLSRALVDTRGETALVVVCRGSADNVAAKLEAASGPLSARFSSVVVVDPVSGGAVRLACKLRVAVARVARALPAPIRLRAVSVADLAEDIVGALFAQLYARGGGVSSAGARGVPDTAAAVCRAVNDSLAGLERSLGDEIGAVARSGWGPEGSDPAEASASAIARARIPEDAIAALSAPAPAMAPGAAAGGAGLAAVFAAIDAAGPEGWAELTRDTVANVAAAASRGGGSFPWVAVLDAMCTSHVRRAIVEPHGGAGTAADAGDGGGGSIALGRSLNASAMMLNSSVMFDADSTAGSIGAGADDPGDVSVRVRARWTAPEPSVPADLFAGDANGGTPCVATSMSVPTAMSSSFLLEASMAGGSVLGSARGHPSAGSFIVGGLPADGSCLSARTYAQHGLYHHHHQQPHHRCHHHHAHQQQYPHHQYHHAHPLYHQQHPGLGRLSHGGFGPGVDAGGTGHGLDARKRARESIGTVSSSEDPQSRENSRRRDVDASAEIASRVDRELATPLNDAIDHERAEFERLSRLLGSDGMGVDTEVENAVPGAGSAHGLAKRVRDRGPGARSAANGTRLTKRRRQPRFEILADAFFDKVDRISHADALFLSRTEDRTDAQ